MGGLRFEWDPQKAALNLAKHGVSFDEAVTVFYDDAGLLIDDPDHSNEEERFILLGPAKTFVFSSWCIAPAKPKQLSELIWARRANRIERHWYTARNS
jgi:uncharacterized protein